jgi:hypothetical protein
LDYKTRHNESFFAYKKFASLAKTNIGGIERQNEKKIHANGN